VNEQFAFTLPIYDFFQKQCNFCYSAKQKNKKKREKENEKNIKKWKK